MLALLGLVTIVTLLVVIMMKWISPLVALILIPVAAALIGGFGWDTGKFIVSGLQSLAPVVGMFVFAILFFGVVTDAGMLDPIIDRILRTVGTKPTRIVMGTTLLALLIHLDGSGAVTFLITIPAMLPLYDKLGIDRRILACAASMAAGGQFFALDWPNAAGVGRTQTSNTRNLQSVVTGPDRRFGVYIWCFLLARAPGRTPAWYRSKSFGCEWWRAERQLGAAGFETRPKRGGPGSPATGQVLDQYLPDFGRVGDNSGLWR
jgi:H+/gluconate symporter-like permease